MSRCMPYCFLRDSWQYTVGLGIYCDMRIRSCPMHFEARRSAGVQAAVRGLQEELGITADASSVEGPIVPVHLRQLDVPELGVRDHEFVTSFRYAIAPAADCL